MNTFGGNCRSFCLHSTKPICQRQLKFALMNLFLHTLYPMSMHGRTNRTRCCVARTSQCGGRTRRAALRKLPSIWKWDAISYELGMADSRIALHFYGSLKGQSTVLRYFREKFYTIRWNGHIGWETYTRLGSHEWLMKRDSLPWKLYCVTDSEQFSLHHQYSSSLVLSYIWIGREEASDPPGLLLPPREREFANQEISFSSTLVPTLASWPIDWFSVIAWNRRNAHHLACVNSERPMPADHICILAILQLFHAILHSICLV